MDTEKLIRKAQTLIQALPYMQQFHGKTIVIKYGGNAMINEEIKNSVMEDITLLKFIGLKPVVVHGGGPDISAELKSHGVESKFINGLRVTDEQTVNIARMVLVGKTNKEMIRLAESRLIDYRRGSQKHPGIAHQNAKQKAYKYAMGHYA